MEVMVWVTAALVTIIVGGIGMLKLIGNQAAKEQAVRLGYDKIAVPIGVAEVLAVVGLIVGAASDALQWVGVVAAVAILGMMVGALAVHIRAGDHKSSEYRQALLPSLVVIVLTSLYLVGITS